MDDFRLSSQQLAVVEWVRSGTGNGYVEAVAGSGKTTALLAACAAIHEPVQFAAFNRKIADEIAVRAKDMGLQHVQVGTFHSFGLAAWKRLYRDVRAGPEAALAKRGEAFNMAHTPAGQRSALARLVGFCKQSALLPAGVSPDACRDLIERFGLEPEFPQMHTPGALEDVSVAVSRLLQAHTVLADAYLDFDDMIYMPVITPECAVRATPWVMVDEAQDTNTARRELAWRMTVSGTGRMLWVGDENQAIYGFSGADADAVEHIKDGLLCHEMPLTVTYRCPRSIVERARAIVPDITAADSAPEGVVREIEADKDGAYFTLRERLKPSDAILCRNTAPLVRTALRILQQGMACQVEGRDIGRSLDQLIVKITAGGEGQLPFMLDALARYERAESETMLAAGTPYKAQSVHDRCDTIRALCEDLDTGRGSVRALRLRIEELFKDTGPGRQVLTLSTVHKAKGREWRRVYLLHPKALMPSKRARPGWELEQEHNLMYVAYTRAQFELVFVE